MAYPAQQTPQRISLSLTASYAPSWELWEGVRELVQNWHDGLLSSSCAAAAAGTTAAVTPGAPLTFEDASPEESPEGGRPGRCFRASRLGAEVGWCEYDADGRKLVLVNRGVGLGRQVLLLGYSKKAQHQDVIGSFGEGLKVGAVALLRGGLRLRMLTKSEAWTFELAVDPAFGERVLTVAVAARPPELDLEVESLPPSLASLSLSDTATVLEGIKPEEWYLLSHRFLFLKPPQTSVQTEVGRLLLDPRHEGDFFVRGVWINKDPDIAAGVDLFDIRLDRDRAAVLKKSDLQHQVSSMWVRAVHHAPELQERYYELLASEKQCSDTALADLYCDEDIAEAMAAAFRQRHGEAIPVSLKDSNSSKAGQVRAALEASTIVCNQALLAVLKKGGVRCDLDVLLQESELHARRFLPLADLPEAELRCLVQACRLAEVADPAVAPLVAVVDVFESQKAFSREAIATAAEAFAGGGGGGSGGGGRAEVDRRVLDVEAVHSLLPKGYCLSAGSSVPCWCRQSLLACSLHALRTSGARFGMERLAAQLGPGQGCADDKVLRCPDLGRTREEALRSQITALEQKLHEERAAHADALRSLRRRVDEAEKELRQTEFKFMDAADAERAVREKLEPELDRLRGEVAQLAAARAGEAAAAKEASERGKEVAWLRRQAEDLRTKLGEVETAAARRVEAAEASTSGLRRALAQRRELLQKMVREDPSGPLIALSDGEELRAALEEIRLALRAEGEANTCCICADGPANALLLPCRHQRMCTTCAAAVRTCPFCRCSIESRMEVYA